MEEKNVLGYLSILKHGLAETCRIFETVEASRQKELIFVCTENPVTVQHVKVDYRFLIHPMIPLQKLKKKKCVYI